MPFLSPLSFFNRHPLSADHRSAGASASHLAARILASFGALCVGGICAAQSAQPPAVHEALDQPWRMTAFAQEAGLARQNILNFDFTADGTLWVAASDCLARYDGYSWRRFTTADGLPSNFVRTVCVTRGGDVWVGTDKGAGTFDGRQFNRRGSEKGLAGPSVRRIYEDPDGTVWFCTDQWPDTRVKSGLTAWRNGRWTSYTREHGLPHDVIWNYFRDASGQQFALTPKGVAQRFGERWGPPDGGAELGDTQIWEMVESKVHGVVARALDAYFVRQNGVWRRIVPPSSQHRGITPPLAVTADQEILTCDYDGSRFGLARWTGQDVEVLRPLFEGYDSNLQCIRAAPDGSIWFSSSGILSRWQRTGGEWREYEHLPWPRLLDRHGSVWFRDDDDETLYRAADGIIGTVPGARGVATLDAGNNVWVHGMEQGLLEYGQVTRTYSAAECGMTRVNGHLVDAKGLSWFDGTDAQGRTVATSYDGQRWNSLPFPLQNGEVVADSAIDPVSGVWYLLLSEEAGTIRCVHFDGDRVRAVNPRFDGQLGGTFYVTVDQDGDLWLSGHPGLFRCRAREAAVWEPMDHVIGHDVGKGQRRGNELWFPCGSWTGGQSGFVSHRDGTWTTYSAGESELLVVARDGTLYTGTEGAINVVAPGAIQPTQITLPSNQQARTVVKASRGDLWLGVIGEDGGTVSVFNYRADRVPPRTFLQLPREVRTDRSLAVELTTTERFVSRRQTRVYQYSWRFDDGAWTDFQGFPAAGLSVSALGAGTHRLQLRARDEGGDIEPVPVEQAFVVLPVPLQERPWFKPSVLAGFALILGLALLAAERARRLAHANAALAGAHEQLEQRVTERTAELSRSNEKLAAEIAERERAQHELVAAQSRLLETSRAAGMAEVATSVLHNVGNVLNSVNVATALVIDRMQSSQVGSLEKLSSLLQAQAGNLAEFVTTDPRGRHVPEFIARLATVLGAERTAALGELAQLRNHVEHIKHIVAMQQSYAKVSGVAETVSATDIVEDALRINAATIGRERIEVVRRFEAQPLLVIERHKVLQILVNLIRNAEHACEESGRTDRRMGVRVAMEGDQVVIAVDDNGVGIAPANLTRIFGQGFTTRKNGHGFGLHSSALAAAELGGKLSVASGGLGAGATFTLRLPLTQRAGTTRTPFPPSNPAIASAGRT